MDTFNRLSINGYSRWLHQSYERRPTNGDSRIRYILFSNSIDLANLHRMDHIRMPLWIRRFNLLIIMSKFMFPTKYFFNFTTGVVNSILSCKSYVPLNRLSYSCYLIHPPIMVYFFFSQGSLIHAHLLALVKILFNFFSRHKILYFFIFKHKGLSSDWIYYCHFYMQLLFFHVF